MGLTPNYHMSNEFRESEKVLFFQRVSTNISLAIQTGLQNLKLWINLDFHAAFNGCRNYNQTKN